MIQKVRVGIPVIGGSGWQGGASHMELHVKAVASLPHEERPQLHLVIAEEMLAGFAAYRPFLSLFDGLIFLGERLTVPADMAGLPLIHCRDWDELFTQIDFFFPVSFNVLPGRCAASWIHDFQHKHLPQFFTEGDIALRDELCSRIARHSVLVFCSSKAVESDFWRFYPQSPALTRVLALRVWPENSWYASDPLAVQQHYDLPDRFILCCNQFWIHKNHRILFAALALLRQSGQDVHLVCTGLTDDFRYPGYRTELEQYMADLGITDAVHILGLIPRSDQIQLIRRSLFVVQPSLFEGLGLIVQECRTLGKSIIVSDLDVHKEHQYGICFRRNSAEDLAAKIAALYAVSQPGPDRMREMEGKMQANDLAAAYGREFVRLVEESQQLFAQANRLSAANCSRRAPVLLATSIQTGAALFASQRRAVDSWLQTGFSVSSLNRPEDIALLRDQFPQVTFVPVSRDGRMIHRAPYVYVDDLLDYITQSGYDTCGIVEPDICLYGSGLASCLAKETVNCLVYQEKVNIQPLEVYEGILFPGMGCMFLDRRLAAVYPRSGFCLSTPFWDHWLIVLAVISKIPVKRITTPFAYHILHEEQYDVAALLDSCEKLATYAPPPFTLGTDTLLKYQHILAELIRNHAIDMALPCLTYKGEES